MGILKKIKINSINNSNIQSYETDGWNIYYVGFVFVEWVLLGHVEIIGIVGSKMFEICKETI
jgi:hypothetical protein